MTDLLNRNLVAIFEDKEVEYPSNPPFHPPMDFPEYPFKNKSKVDSHNLVYSGVRELLHLLEMDNQRYNTPEWNPFGEFIAQGDNVLIKPNFVYHFNPIERDPTRGMIVHGSILRPIMDYVIIANGGKGKITIADAPLQSSDWKEIIFWSGIAETIKYYHEVFHSKIDLIDFREERVKTNRRGAIIKRIRLPGDPNGYKIVNLGLDSELAPISKYYHRYEVGDYDRIEMIRHHDEIINEYYIPNTVLDADVVINVPKLKTHCKAGVTLSLKNLVGVNAKKSCLPHYRIGALSEGGDEFHFCSVRRSVEDYIVKRLKIANPVLRESGFFIGYRIKGLIKMWPHLKKDNREEINSEVHRGSWYGNDTLWRTIIDLNKVLFYANKSGKMCISPQRQVFTLIDGIIAGEREGPLKPTPRRCGILVGGYNPIAVDITATKLMGFDYRKIRKINNSFKLSKYSLSAFKPDKIECRANVPKWKRLFKGHKSLEFRPPNGWKGHIELD